MLADLRALRRRVESGAVRPESRRPDRLWLHIAVLAGIVAVVLLSVSLFFLRSGLQLSPPPETRPRQLTTSPGTKGEPALSPDDGLVAYTSDETGAPERVTLGTGPADPRRVTSGAEAKRVRFDPSSGDLLVSGSWDSGRTELRRMRPSGGGAVPVTPPVFFGTLAAAGDFGVSADGTLLVYDQEDVHGEIWALQVRRGSF